MKDKFKNILKLKENGNDKKYMPLTKSIKLTELKHRENIRDKLKKKLKRFS